MRNGIIIIIILKILTYFSDGDNSLYHTNIFWDSHVTIKRKWNIYAPSSPL
jgi:hypothetical protein